MSTRFQGLVVPPTEDEISEDWLRVETRPRTVQTLLTDEQIERSGLAVISDQLEQARFSSDVHEITRSKLFKREWLVEVDALEAVQETCAPPEWLGRVIERVDSLRELALDEELPFSEASAEALLGFCSRLRSVSRPSTFLLGNGNLWVLWLNERQEQVGLQFRENLVQYVVFRARNDTLVQTLGVDTVEGVLDTIRRLGLMSVMRA